MQNSDQELTVRLRSEKERHAAFQELVTRYQERLYWHIRKIVLHHDDADDVLQNTFLKVWKNLGQFREESSLFTWLYRIATNESITFINARKRHTLVSMDDMSDTLKNRLEADDYYEGTAIQKKLQQAILTLPEKQRLVFNMRYFDEVPYQQMSEILDTSVGALKASYHHAARKVEDFLTGTD
ncbi:MAG: sigma-70 family RNA polymerase sigma factor [Prolixibacteraceae bacterium]|jgi:RNA polymerase sigma-70 factor (ECF subfamily)|nr:sigma-70 family RNA polymerase sigma factor [Prolixibacteraceae bacterium]NLX29984.1 sigma-70 family RNA polymerase sigma factor [Bacteroidales bacterium]HNQ37381.1 sigma-70 family RNA polymerase sigma factor [Prolixibacteraceae bacterium]HPJ79788.1 sigma-70 family RNA polymerase sigma factor [Prolixibacteraceae bacterium]HRV88298.1 sigma-70 family RNA polymerase sigma factor [Prolixibacteraceae bacterium]